MFEFYGDEGEPEEDKVEARHQEIKQQIKCLDDALALHKPRHGCKPTADLIDSAIADANETFRRNEVFIEDYLTK